MNKRVLLSIVAVTGLAAGAQGIIVTETGDAGAFPFQPAQDISGSANVLNRLDGALLPDGDIDVDVYRITISDPAQFSATVTGGALEDTTIYLFSTAGFAIAKNDDISSANFLSAFPVGNAAYASLTPGDYLFAISIFGTIPFSVGSPTSITESVFDPNQFTGVTLPRFPSASVQSWANASTWTEGGSYEVTFTGVTTAIPAPSVLAALAMGGLVGRRRRR